ncbi:MAG: helix-turn-helix domain-containing protein [Aestuariivita sp.]|nr:helix-turn-helix domain-containing protein [Aestuariivita sp.]
MPSGTHPLTYPERCHIYALKKSGYSIRAIAKELGRSHTTLSRELRRNSGDRASRITTSETHREADSGVLGDD